MSVSIAIDHVVKKFGDNVIIPDLTANIKNGELFTLLGPSGCGKTTLLRMIAGFNSIEGGTIAFGDQVINDLPAYKRNIGMVLDVYKRQRRILGEISSQLIIPESSFPGKSLPL